MTCIYNPCIECNNRYETGYTEECDNTCEYAHFVKRIKNYGGIEEVSKVMEGKSVPVSMLEKENIDNIYKIVYCAKHDLI